MFPLFYFRSGAIGVSLYGNDDLHNGLTGFIASAKAIDEKINAVKNQVSNESNNGLQMTIASREYCYL